jgi:hypothetical protein
MAETAYKYTSNKDPYDGTVAVVLEVDNKGEPTKVLYQDGDPVVLTDEQAQQVKGRFNITKQSSDDASEGSPKAASSQDPAVTDSQGPKVDPSVNKR